MYVESRTLVLQNITIPQNLCISSVVGDWMDGLYISLFRVILLSSLLYYYYTIIFTTIPISLSLRCYA